MENLVIDASFWNGRRVFLTGHTGFKGSWLVLWLKKLGAQVTGYALEPPTSPCIYRDANVLQYIDRSVSGDVCCANKLLNALQDSAPEIVIHMAAQSLVRDSYINPVRTYNTNVIGVVNLLESVRNIKTVKAVLNITTDKCYENKELVRGYREDDPLGGYDPYSSSKGCSELVSSAYRKSFLSEKGIALATARAGNVIGGGDWAKDRIIPDAMRSFIKNKKLMVRNPNATRPWQHVLEPLLGYLVLCQKLVEQPKDFVGGWNFGPNDEDVQAVSTLADILVDSWGDGVEWCLDKSLHPHETSSLKLDCSKAKTQLKWSPIWSLERSLNESVQWYKAWFNKADMDKFTLNQIETFHKDCLAQ